MPTSAMRTTRSGARRHRSAWIGLLGASALLVVACGGDDGDGATAAPAAEATNAPAADVTDAPLEQAVDAFENLDFGDGTASVTLGGETIEFSLGTGEDADGNPRVGACREVFGILQVAGWAADGRDIQLDAMIPPVDWETFDDGRYDPASVEVEIAEGNQQLIADAQRAEERGWEGSAVTDFENDGTTASGSASFYDSFAFGDEPPDLVEGTFTFSCAG